jgi:hypothetical protein
MHHSNFDESQRRMAKCTRYTTYSVKPKTLPQANCPFICGNHKIKLYRAKATLSSSFQGVCAHRAGYAAAGRGQGSTVPAVRYVRAASALIGPEKVSAQDRFAFYGDKNLMSRTHPISKRSVTAHVGG